MIGSRNPVKKVSNGGRERERQTLTALGRSAWHTSSEAGLRPGRTHVREVGGGLPPCPTSADVGYFPPLDTDGRLMVTEGERESLDRFKDLLRLRTISAEGPTNGAYAAAVDQLRALADSFELKTAVHMPNPGKPILQCTWLGSDPSLPSLLLNSHYDVVPCIVEKWHSDPFEPREEPNGDIYARGAQDMKCVCLQHLEAVGRMKRSGVNLPRTIHLTFVPDEEVGGLFGVGTFVGMDAFKKMNVGVALDEGLARPDDRFTVYYGERAVWWCRVEAKGPTGHASQFVRETAVEKLLRVLSKIQAFRAEEESKMDAPSCGCKLGQVATVNITMLEAGVKTTVDEESGVSNYAFNVIPDVARAGFDTRVPPNYPVHEYKARIDEWCSEEGVAWNWEVCTPNHFVTSVDENASPWFRAFKGAVPEAETEIFPAGTDCRYFRQLGIPAFGFSPMNRTPLLLHDHNEFINGRVFLDGIGIFTRLITALASVLDDRAGPQPHALGRL